MKTEEQMDDILDRYDPFITWINDVIEDDFEEGITSERTAGVHFKMLINTICGIDSSSPAAVIDLTKFG